MCRYVCVRVCVCKGRVHKVSNRRLDSVLLEGGLLLGRGNMKKSKECGTESHGKRQIA